MSWFTENSLVSLSKLVWPLYFSILNHVLRFIVALKETSVDLFHA